MGQSISGVWKDEDSGALVHIDAPMFDKEIQDLILLRGTIKIIEGTFRARDRTALTFRSVLPKLKWRLIVLSSVTFEETDADGHDCYSFNGLAAYGPGMYRLGMEIE